jgi:hypothetical protein
MYELSHVSAEYDHYQVFNNSRKSTFTVRYMLNCTLIFDVLQYDVNQTLVSVTPWCVTLFSTNSSPLVHPPVKLSPRPAPEPPPPAGTFS